MLDYNSLRLLLGNEAARKLIEPCLPKPGSPLWYCESHDEAYSIDWVGLVFTDTQIRVDSGLYRLNAEGYPHCTSDQRIMWANRELPLETLREQGAPEEWFDRVYYPVTRTCAPGSLHRYGLIDPMRVLSYIHINYRLVPLEK